MKKMILNEDITIVKSKMDSANDIYKFVGGDIWGYPISEKISEKINVFMNGRTHHSYNIAKKNEVIRTEQNIQGIKKKELSRTVFDFGAKDVFKNNLPVSNNSLQTTNLSKEYIEKIIDISFCSSFKSNQNFVSSNYVISKWRSLALKTYLSPR